MLETHQPAIIFYGTILGDHPGYIKGGAIIIGWLNDNSLHFVFVFTYGWNHIALKGSRSCIRGKGGIDIGACFWINQAVQVFNADRDHRGEVIK